MSFSGGKDEERKIWAMQGFSGGLVSYPPAHALNGTQSPDAENFTPSVAYRLQKRAGTSNFSGTKGSPSGTVINGLGAFAFENGTSILVAKEGAVIQDISAGNWNTTITGYAPSDGDLVYFSMFKNLLIATSTARPTPQKYNGSGGFGNLGGSPPAAAYNIAHRRRMWLANTSADPSRIYCSAVDNPEDWSTTDAVTDFYLGRGDGFTINGLASNGEVLYVSKIAQGSYEGALWIILGDAVTGQYQFQARKLAHWGAVNQWAMIPIDRYIAVASKTGIYLINGTQFNKIYTPFRADYEALTDAQRAKICLGRQGNQLWVAYPASGSTNTKAWVFDLETRIWSRYNPCLVGIFATHPDGSLYGASATSTIKVLKHNTGTSDESSAAISLYWETPNLDFGAWYADKRWFQTFLHCNSSALTWTLTHYIDDVSQSDSQTFVPASGTIVKRIVGKGSEKYGRFWRFRIAESSTSAAEAYGIQVEADVLPRTR